MKMRSGMWDLGAILGVGVLVCGFYFVHWKLGVISAGAFIVLACILGACAYGRTDDTTKR